MNGRAEQTVSARPVGDSSRPRVRPGASAGGGAARDTTTSRPRGAFIERGVRMPSESGAGLLRRWGARDIGRARGTNRPRFHAGWKLPGGGRRQQRRPPRPARTHPDRGRTAHCEPARAVGTSQSASFSGRRSGRGERRDVPDRGHRAPPHLARANRWKSPGDRRGPRAGWIRRRWAPCRARGLTARWRST